MENIKNLDDYVVAIPKEEAALVYVYEKGVEKIIPPVNDLILSIPDSVEYIKNQNREMCYIVADENPVVLEYLKENGMLANPKISQ